MSSPTRAYSCSREDLHGHTTQISKRRRLTHHCVRSFDYFNRAVGCLALRGATRTVCGYERSRNGWTLGEVVKCADYFGATFLVVPRQQIESTTSPRDLASMPRREHALVVPRNSVATPPVASRRIMCTQADLNIKLTASLFSRNLGLYLISSSAKKATIVRLSCKFGILGKLT